MTGHYTYLQSYFPSPEWQKLALAVLLGCALVILGALLTRRIATREGISAALVPSKTLSVFGFFDFLVERLLWYQDSVMGKENRRYLPFTGSLFLFILVSNFISLVPGMPAVTTVVWVNVGMALVVYLFFNIQGIKEQGVVAYFKHFCGPVLVLAPFLFALEVFLSLPLRILTLNLRLYWNITVDHMLVEIFTSLLGPVFPAVFYLLGTFVSFMQAFIFTTLTMVYILLAVKHEEEH